MMVNIKSYSRYGRQPLTHKGWKYESARHSLAARGISTRGKSESQIRRLLIQSESERVRVKGRRIEVRPLLRVLDQYLLWQRKAKGPGALYSMRDVELTREQILKSGDQWAIDKSNDIMEKIRAYERSGFVPKVPLRKEERALVRAIEKSRIGTPLRRPEVKALRAYQGPRPKPKPSVRIVGSYKEVQIPRASISFKDIMSKEKR